ncbi:esterase/lipase [Apiospora arundinis]|uniref:Dienelactone hydrolase n=1 Tax=Apiospora arundinis TaxID=335852 RepID=A0ABR2HU03_9PEZI
MASLPPGECCARAVLHEGTPTGQSVKVGAYDGYLAVPASAKARADNAAILYLPDIFSLSQNAKLIADQYAAEGYLTLIVDVMNGDALPIDFNPDGFDFPKFLAGGSSGDNPHTPEAVDAVVKAGIKYLTEEKGVKKLGSVGYCFGAKYVARHYPAIQAGYMAHPSWVSEEELAAFQAPLSIAAAQDDFIFTTELRHQSEEILKKRAADQPWQINVYSGVQHGFATRCDLSQKHQRWAKEQAFFQAVSWFNTWL